MYQILRKKTRIFLFFPALILLCAGWADSWEDIRKQSGNIRSLQADFVQEKHMKILKNPLTSKGIFCFQAPGSLRWEYREPVQSILLSHAGKTKRYVKGKEGFVQESGGGMQAMQMVMDEIGRWMKGEFRDNPDYRAILEPGPAIRLRPKQDSFSKIIQEIKIALSPDRPGIIDEVTIYESEDSYTRIIFRNAEINSQIPESRFQEI